MNFYDLTVLDTNDQEVNLSDYKGKVLLVVNTATKCGFTKQYAELQELYAEYSSKGFEILDFPCNQFLAQAPGDANEILQFCQSKFNITFKQFKKIKVNGKDQIELFSFLKDNAPENKGKNIKWNFTKFLISKNGEVTERFEPPVKPLEIRQKIAKLLEE